jgi:hypothetical protein
VSAVRWLIGNLFYSVPSTLATLLLAYLAWRVMVPFVDWAFVHAIWSAPDSTPCREARGVGACWALIGEKHRFILFGTYPYEQHWRPALGIVLLLVLYAGSAMRRFWRPALAGAWLAGLAAIGVLMWGMDARLLRQQGYPHAAHRPACRRRHSIHAGVEQQPRVFAHARNVPHRADSVPAWRAFVSRSQIHDGARSLQHAARVHLAR